MDEAGEPGSRRVSVIYVITDGQVNEDGAEKEGDKASREAPCRSQRLVGGGGGVMTKHWPCTWSFPGAVTDLGWVDPHPDCNQLRRNLVFKVNSRSYGESTLNLMLYP